MIMFTKRGIRICLICILIAVFEPALRSQIGFPNFADVPDDPQTVREMVDNIQKVDDVPSDAAVLYQEITNAKQQYETYRTFRNNLHVESLDTQKNSFHANIEGLRTLADE